MNTITMPIPHPMTPIFPHEGTLLFQRARALHAYAARLASEPDAPTGRRALKRAAKSAFVTIAGAGTAVSENACAAVLRRARTWLARCSAEITSLVDEGSITRDVARFARLAVQSVQTELAMLPTALALGFPAQDHPFEDEAIVGPTARHENIEGEAQDKASNLTNGGDGLPSEELAARLTEEQTDQQNQPAPPGRRAPRAQPGRRDPSRKAARAQMPPIPERQSAPANGKRSTTNRTGSGKK